jgi:hypothetical protein
VAAAGTGAAAAVVGRAAAAQGGGVKAWNEARLDGVIIIPPLAREAAVLVLDWCRGEEADTMAGGTEGGGEPVTTPPDDSGIANADADDEPDDKDDERASLLLLVVVSRIRRVGEGEEPDSSDKIPGF